jgi:Ca2+-transporting ATPase
VPLLPIHILFINLVTDSLPALALAAEPAEGDVMRRPPRPPSEGILEAGLWQHALWVGLLMGASALAALVVAEREEAAQTMVFTVLTIAQLLHVLVVRSERRALLARGLFANPALLVSVAGLVGLQLAVIYLPALNVLLDTRPLNIGELLTCVALATIAPIAAEIEKGLRNR